MLRPAATSRISCGGWRMCSPSSDHSLAAFGRMTAGVADALLAAPISVPRLFLHPDGLAPRIANLDV
jgi:hypothetical protein